MIPRTTTARRVLPGATLLALSWVLPSCGRVTEDADATHSGGSSATGGQSGAGGQATSGGSSTSAGQASTGGASGGSAPLPEGCLGVPESLTGPELVARVRKRLGVELSSSDFDVPGEKPTVRGLRLTEAVDSAVRDAGPPVEMSELLYDFIVQQLLHDSHFETGMPAFASELSPELAADMDEEFELSIASWAREGRATMSHLFTDSTGFVNPALAAHYGVAPPPSDQFSPVALPEGQQMGVLTRGAFLARYGDLPARAPHLAQALACVTIPPLPVMTTVWAQPGRPPAKQVVAQSYGDDQVTCAACHRYYVGYGIALDRYDELGRYREAQNGIDIDTSAHLYLPSDMPETTDGDAVAFSGPQELGRALAASSGVRRCFATRLVERLGLPELETKELGCVLQAFAASDASLTSLLAILAPRVVSLE
ncbi:MAG TPA: DUF1588 domain-containing protein [Polyangiaceae bacterium]|nr:DUF1588 domain-containing protein [Polyangiaceae bacterium]